MHASQLLSRFVIMFGLGAVAIAPTHPAIALNSTPYPDETIESFTQTCVTQGSGAGVPVEVMRQICTCTIDGLQQQYTYAEFAKIDRDLGAGKPAPEQMNQIVKQCVDDQVPGK